MTDLRPGAVAWRIAPRTGSAPLRCIVVRVPAGGDIEVRASTFSRNMMTVQPADLFADRDACRAEIQRRRAVP